MRSRRARDYSDHVSLSVMRGVHEAEVTSIAQHVSRRFMIAAHHPR